MWHPKEVNFVEVVNSGTSFRLGRKSLSSVKKYDLKKMSLIMTSSWHHELPYDTHLQKLNNCAKFDVCMLTIFGAVKIVTLAESRFIFEIQIICNLPFY